MPLLKVDDKIVFESSVISEFVNDIGALDLHPEDAIVKANNRSWIAFLSLFDDLFGLVIDDVYYSNIESREWHLSTLLID